jgi:acyl-CoA synthetase (AMP-forming)/AMP-acid ligase II
MRKVEMARELALEENPKVSMAVVVEIPDPLWSEVGVALVVLTAASAVTPEEFRRECRTRLANYKVPKQIVVLDEVPRLEVGKVDRNGLRALARERFAPEDS